MPPDRHGCVRGPCSVGTCGWHSLLDRSPPDPTRRRARSWCGDTSGNVGNRGPERTATAGSEGARVAAFAPDPSGHLTVKVKAWVAVPELLVAVMVKVVTPAALGVPEIVALPLPLLVKVIPAGSDPVLPSVGTGYPVAVTVKLNALP